jgi:hypothetical protein
MVFVWNYGICMTFVCNYGICMTLWHLYDIMAFVLVKFFCHELSFIIVMNSLTIREHTIESN